MNISVHPFITLKHSPHPNMKKKTQVSPQTQKMMW